MFVLMEIETLGQACNAKWSIGVRCAQGKKMGMKSIPECGHTAKLDMETLLWTRGENFPLERLETRLKCPRCWSRRVAVIFDRPLSNIGTLQ